MSYRRRLRSSQQHQRNNRCGWHFDQSAAPRLSPSGHEPRNYRYPLHYLKKVRNICSAISTLILPKEGRLTQRTGNQYIVLWNVLCLENRQARGHGAGPTGVHERLPNGVRGMDRGTQITNQPMKE